MVWGLVRCDRCARLFQRDINSALNILTVVWAALRGRSSLVPHCHWQYRLGGGLCPLVSPFVSSFSGDSGSATTGITSTGTKNSLARADKLAFTGSDPTLPRVS
jgi:hypothetical protein